MFLLGQDILLGDTAWSRLIRGFSKAGGAAVGLAAARVALQLLKQDPTVAVRWIDQGRQQLLGPEDEEPERWYAKDDRPDR